MKEFLTENFAYIVLIVMILPEGVVSIIKEIKRKDNGGEK